VKSPRLLVAVVGVLALAVAGCTSHAGAAAQVDDRTISTATLSGVVDRGMTAYTDFAAAHPDVVAQAEQQTGQGPLTRDTVQRQWLNYLVTARLDEAEAGKLGITLSPQEAAGFYQDYAVYSAGSAPAFEKDVPLFGIDPRDVRIITDMWALESKIEDAVSPDLISTEATAKSDYASRVSMLGPLPLSFTEMLPFLERNNMLQQRTAKLTPLLIQESRTVGVSVSPRFGVWSPDDLAVLAQSGSVATVPTPIPTLNLG
jgi:hypothetical protein